jgi:gliding motility-associated-like protein
LSCYNSNDGSIILNISGGILPYMCNWSSGDKGFSINNKSQGNYNAIITDSNGCKTILNASISQPPEFVFSYNIIMVSCFGGKDGSISTAISGGTPSFHYLWSTGDTTNNLNNLKTGSYYITITEGNGCKTIDTIIVKEPLTLQLQYTDQNAGCQGEHNGSINITVNGGTTPYSFIWNSGHTTRDIANLCKGEYKVTVTDFHSCIISSCLIILTSFPLPQPNIFPDSAITACKFDLVKINVVEDYHLYNWNNGETTKSISIIGKGFFYAQVIDSNGCKGQTKSIQIMRTDPSVWIDLENEYTYCPDDGPLVLSPGKRVKGFYNWDPTGDTSFKIIVTNEGRYIVTLTVSGCKASDSTEVFQVCPPKVFIPNAITPNGDGLNDFFKISALNVDHLNYIIFDRWGTIIFRGNNETETWDATMKNSLVQMDAYGYIVWYSNNVYGKFMKKGSISVLY